MTHSLKHIVAALAVAGLAHTAQAAHWELVDTGVAYDRIAFAASVDGTPWAHVGTLNDLSSKTEVLRANDDDGTADLGSATLDYAWDGLLAVGTSVADPVTLADDGSRAPITLAGIGAATFTAIADGVADSGSIVADIALSGLKLRIAADGEALGSPVKVRFNGLASFFQSSDIALERGDLYVGIDAAVAGTPVGSYASPFGADGDLPASFEFLANVGDEVELTLTLHGEAFASGPAAFSAGDVASLTAYAALSGELAIAAVPEPQTYAMLLAGLGLLGFAARRQAAR